MFTFKEKLINFNLFCKIAWICDLFFLSLNNINFYKKGANIN